MTTQTKASEDRGLYRLVKARHGRFLANPNDVYVGQALITYGEYSEQEMRVLEQLIPEGGVVVEVGANIGAHTVPLARHVGRRGRVHAFEPQPMIFQNLCANLALNGLLNVYAYNSACGAETGSVVIPDIDYTVAGNFGGIALERLPENAHGQSVAIRPLDDLSIRRLDLVKIDAEGMEIDVIQGAQRTLSARKPVLYVENDRRDRSEHLIRLLQELGYRLWWHLPRLFSSRNWGGKGHDLWPGVVSINMLAIHRTREAKINGLKEISDPTERPLKN